MANRCGWESRIASARVIEWALIDAFSVIVFNCRGSFVGKLRVMRAGIGFFLLFCHEM